MNPRLKAYAQLLRLDKPIGSYLLLWPTLWGLWIAGNGQPPSHIVLIFVIGVLVMRSAGCAVNDIVDRDIDPHVERTKLRPLAAKTMSLSEALIIFVLLLVIAAGLAWQLNRLSLLLAIPAAVIAVSYPFMKRFHSLPQAHLGLAFSFGIPMAFAAIQNQIPWQAWLLMAINWCWVMVYDTCYAISDREDDLKIGVKSSAILFGKADRLIIGLLQLLMVILLWVFAQQSQLPTIFYIAIAIVVCLFSYQQWLIKDRQRLPCFQAFLHNNWVGLTVFIGIVLSYLP